MVKQLLWSGYYWLGKVFPLERHRMVVAKFFVENKRRDWLIEHPLKMGAVVYELGGFTGEFSEKLLQRFGSQVELHVFEPIPSFFEVLKKKFGDRSAVNLHEYGCGRSNTYAELKVAGEGTSAFRDHGSSEMVVIRDIAEILEELGHQNVDLLSINIEGGEYEVLDQLLERDLLKRFERIQIQFHRVVNEAESWRAEILRKLQATHDATFSYPFVWEGFERRDPGAMRRERS